MESEIEVLPEGASAYARWEAGELSAADRFLLQRLEGIDQIICATGQRPDLSSTSELRVSVPAPLQVVAGWQNLQLGKAK